MSKRTIILIVVAVVAFLAAIGSLYLEKNQVVKQYEDQDQEDQDQEPGKEPAPGTPTE